MKLNGESAVSLETLLYELMYTCSYAMRILINKWHELKCGNNYY